MYFRVVFSKVFACRDTERSEGAADDRSTNTNQHLLAKIMEAKMKELTEISDVNDPTVTVLDNLVIDVDGIIDNDDEVSLETPITNPENPEPKDFGQAVSDALKDRISNVSKSETSESDKLSEGTSSSKCDRKKQVDQKQSSTSNKNSKRTLNTVKRQGESGEKKPTGGKVAKAKVSNSDNLSDSTTTTSKTSSGIPDSSKVSQNTSVRTNVPNKKVGERNPAKTNGRNEAGSAPRKGKGRRRQDMQSDRKDGREPMPAPWNNGEQKPKSAKNNKLKKIDINDMQKDMGEGGAMTWGLFSDDNGIC